MAKPTPVDLRDPEACSACHPHLVAEWKESMHARSHHDRDPIYAGIRGIRMKKEGANIAKACAGCHTPGFEAEPNADKAVVGVGCATCHNAKVGARPGQLLGPNDVAVGATKAHETGPAHASIADGTTLCMECHASLESPKGLSMCATGAEHEATPSEDRLSCSSCHMPRVAGAATTDGAKPDHASHAFLGPHRAWYQDDPAFLASAISASATFDGARLVVEVANATGHAFPTGFPGRQAVVTCVGRDRAGAEVWKCEPRPMGKTYVDADGKPTLAPYAESLASDTRIAPGATQTFAFDPPPEVARATVTVSMRLLPPPLAKKLGLVDALEGATKPIDEIDVSRPEG
jgi:hypothetical protein